MDDIKMIIVSTGSEWKKIIGKLVNETDVYYEFSEAIVLEEMMTEKGIRVIPIPLAQKSKTAVFKIIKDVVVVESFNPSDELINMFRKMTSTIIFPSLEVVK